MPGESRDSASRRSLVALSSSKMPSSVLGQSELRSKSCCCRTSALILFSRSAPWNSQYGTERNQFARAVDNQCAVHGCQSGQYINTNVTDTAIPKLLKEEVFWPKHQVANNRFGKRRNDFPAETPLLVLNSGRSRYIKSGSHAEILFDQLL